MVVKELLDKVRDLEKGFDNAFGDTLDPGGETKRGDRRVAVGLFESEDIGVKDDLAGSDKEDSGWEVVDLW